MIRIVCGWRAILGQKLFYKFELVVRARFGFYLYHSVSLVLLNGKHVLFMKVMNVP